MLSTSKQLYTIVLWYFPACSYEVDESIFFVVPVSCQHSKSDFKVTHFPSWQLIRQKQHSNAHIQYWMLWNDEINKVTHVVGYALRRGATAFAVCRPVKRGMKKQLRFDTARVIRWNTTTRTPAGNQQQDVFGSWTEQTCCRKLRLSAATHRRAGARGGLCIPTLQGLTS